MAVNTVSTPSTSGGKLRLKSLSRGEATKQPTPWVRPSGWPAMPTISPAEAKFVGILAVYDDDSNYIALSCTGNYTVDWGDGTTENVASTVQANHQYSYSNGNLTTTSYGYKCAVVTVTPQAGQQITNFSLYKKHPSVTLSSTTAHWLDISLSFPNLPSGSSLTLKGSGSTCKLPLLQRAQLINVGACNYFLGMFNECRRLKEVFIAESATPTNCETMFQYCTALEIAPYFNTSAVTNPVSMFSGCTSLRIVPKYDFSSATTFNYLFNECSSLEEIPCFNSQNVTNAVRMFYGCSSLQRVPLMNFASVTDMSNCFYLCTSLKEVPHFNLAACQQLNSTFSGCYSLEIVPPFNLASCTNMSSTFQNCASLKKVPQFNTPALTSLAGTFQYCSSLEEVAVFNTSLVTSFNSTFYSCSALRKAPAFNTSSATTLASMFYYCIGLEEVPAYDTSKVTATNGMFNRCLCLERGPAMDTSLVTNISSMFMDCTSLTYVPTYNTSAVTNFDQMLLSCSNLKKIPAFDMSACTSTGSSFATSLTSVAAVAVTGMKRNLAITNGQLSKAGLETIFSNLGKAFDTSQAVTISSNIGADTAVSKASCGTTTGSTTVTCSNTSSLETGMICTGTGVSTGVNVTFQDSADTVTLAGHGLANGTMVSLSAITSTTGISTYTNYWVVNAATDTFQLAATQGGNALALTTDGSGTLLYPAYITSINTNVSVTLSAPASATGSVTLNFRKLDTFKATSKGWTVTG